MMSNKKWSSKTLVKLCVVMTLIFINALAMAAEPGGELTAAQRMTQILDEVMAAQKANDTARIEILRREMAELAPRVREEQNATLNQSREKNPSSFAQDLQHHAQQIKAQADSPEWKISLAARKGDLVEVKRLRSAGAEINFHRLDPAPPLMEAAMKGHVDVARYLIDEGAELRLGKGLIKLDALRLAAEAKEDNSAMLKLLVGKGALAQGDIENIGSAALKDSENKGQQHAQMEGKQITSGSALMAAIENNRPLHVRTLLELGASANDWAFGKSALMLAASKLRVEIVAVLLQHDADVHAVGPQKKTALQFVKAISETPQNAGKREEIINMLQHAMTQ